ncbi:MAG TPA: cupin domain-containing protein [Patescibacteria group bacterium]|jgi:mannose-6-phosphate isomerase-like protein (cupin superfamily)|nr:cupin domain-containing protein [Patescibacteria group bacterium]
MQKNLKDIATETTHDNTTFVKRLITPTGNKGRLATCNYAWLEKGKQLEIHAHPDGEEFYLFLGGKGEMLVGDSWTTVEKDDFVTVPKGSNHSVRNNNDQNLIFITIRTVVD